MEEVGQWPNMASGPILFVGFNSSHPVVASPYAHEITIPTE